MKLSFIKEKKWQLSVTHKIFAEDEWSATESLLEEIVFTKLWKKLYKVFPPNPLALTPSLFVRRFNIKEAIQVSYFFFIILRIMTRYYTNITRHYFLPASLGSSSNRSSWSTTSIQHNSWVIENLVLAFCIGISIIINFQKNKTKKNETKENK